MPRPRDARIDKDLVDAWLQLIAENDYDDITMETIAHRAKVGKPALYRRYPTKAHLAFRASVVESSPAVVPDLGDVREELLLCLATLAERTRQVPRPVLAEQVGAMIADPDFAAQVAAAHAPNDAVVSEVLRRAAERGEIVAGLDHVAAVTDLGGTLLFRMLVRHQPVDHAYRERLVDHFLDGVRASGDRTTSESP